MLHTEDIPNVCNVNLPNAFSNVAEKTITSNGQVLITMLVLSFLDKVFF